MGTISIQIPDVEHDLQLLVSMLENAFEGMFQTGPSGALISANPALARMMEYESAEEILNARMTVRTLFGISPELGARMSRELTEKGIARDILFEARAKNGKRIPVAMNLWASCESSGRVTFLAGCVVELSTPGAKMFATEATRTPRSNCVTFASHASLRRK